MKRFIRKGKALVSIVYTDGDYSNNLFGADFTIEISETITIFCVDMSSNLISANKNQNCYDDAHSLLEKHTKLQSIQVDEMQVTKGFSSYYEKTPHTICKLELNLGNTVLRYTADPQISNNTLFFNINSQI